MRKLLEENTVKRFMKLANIEPLTEGFTAKLDEEDDKDDAGDAGEEPADDDAGDDMDMGDMDMGDDDMGGDAKVDMPEEQVLDLVDAIASAVEDVTGVAVDAVSADDDAGDKDMDMEMDMDDDGDMEVDVDMDAAPGGDDEVLDEMGMKSYKRDYRMNEMDDEDKMEEALLRKLRRLREHKARKQDRRLGDGRHRARALNESRRRRARRRPMQLTEARLNRVAERVMKRIRAEAKAADSKDQLAERVMNRVVKRLNEASRAQKASKAEK